MKSIVTRMLGKCLQRRTDSGVTRRSWPASLTPMVRWLTHAHRAWFSFIPWNNAIPIFYAMIMLTSFSLMESVHLWTPSRHCPTIGRTSCSVCADFRIKFCNIWNVRLLFPWLIAKCSPLPVSFWLAARPCPARIGTPRASSGCRTDSAKKQHFQFSI